MKIELWCIGKTNELYLREGIENYKKRILRYVPFELKIIPDIKATGKLEPFKLLDERGKEFTSIGFSEKLNHLLQVSSKRIIFLVGGAWGIHETLKKRADLEISLSKMTFSHQMIRLFFIEQLYRAFSILNNEPYHNE